MTYRAARFSLAVLVLASGCRRNGDPTLEADRIPPLPTGALVASGVRWAEVKAPRQGGGESRFWVYLPDPLPARPLRCVVIGPAGTRLFHGIDLSEEDRAEHLPYARAGFAVVAFDIDGALPVRYKTAQQREAIRRFKEADAGVKNVKAAIDFALARVPRIDRTHLYVAGHSSAGTLALQAASREPRIKGCIAYAPVTDLTTNLKGIYDKLDEIVPETASVLRNLDPYQNTSRFTCPLFLFHARDDQNVPLAATEQFVRAVSTQNRSVRLEIVNAGGHYESMVKKGIPRAIAWLRSAP